MKIELAKDSVDVGIAVRNANLPEHRIGGQAL